MSAEMDSHETSLETLLDEREIERYISSESKSEYPAVRFAESTAKQILALKLNNLRMEKRLGRIERMLKL